MITAIMAMAVPAFAQDAQEEAPQPAPAERQAVPRGSRPQGDNPRTGTAVPRTPPPPPPVSTPRADAPAAPAPPPRVAVPAPANRGRNDHGWNDRYRGGAVIVNVPPVYNNFYYPRWRYPYGYGAFGLGYFYYDPYRWPGYYPYGPGYYPNVGVVAYDIGELRLQVTPRHAQVFVDGYYAGTVDDYDGTFQSMKMQPGPYSIRIAAPGYEDLMFDVRINLGQKINYKGDLRRLP
jgi:hypothetical protein